MGVKIVGTDVYLPRVLREESKLLNDTTECLESPSTNGQIIIPIIFPVSICRSTSLYISLETSPGLMS